MSTLTDDEAEALLHVARVMHEEAARLGGGVVAERLEESARRLIATADTET